MRHATYHVTYHLSSASVLISRAPKRRRFLAALLGVLHQSRRLQAERVLRQHQHLIARAEQRRADETKSAMESGHVGK